MNFDAIKQDTLDRYIRMAQNPATKAHAWHAANDLAKVGAALFADLPAKLTAAMTKDKQP